MPDYYAMQVQCGKEEKVYKRLSEILAHSPYQALLPKRRLKIRKAGKDKLCLLPLFPGYLFLTTEQEPGPIVYLLKTCPGFYKILPRNGQARCLSDVDLNVLKGFMSFGEIADISKVSFDENNRIVVHAGPLRGKEGLIVKVDRRRCRAQIQICFCQSQITFDLGFECISKIEEGNGAVHGQTGQIEDLHSGGGICRPDPSPGAAG